MNVHEKSIELLERIANSVHEREPRVPNLLCFSSAEVQVVEKWLKEILFEEAVIRASSWD